MGLESRSSVYWIRIWIRVARLKEEQSFTGRHIVLKISGELNGLEDKVDGDNNQQQGVENEAIRNTPMLAVVLKRREDERVLGTKTTVPGCRSIFWKGRIERT